MNALFKKLGSVLDQGTDFLIARELAREEARLPQGYTTQNEQVVQQPTSEPIVENDRLVGAKTATVSIAQRVAIGVAVGSVSALLIYGLKKALKGGSK